MSFCMSGLNLALARYPRASAEWSSARSTRIFGFVFGCFSFLDANQELACVVLQRRSRSIIMLWCWWGGSTAPGVTTALPCWCYELIVSFCDQVGSANVIDAATVAYKSVLQAANPEWLLAA